MKNIEVIKRLVEENGIEIAADGELLDVDSISFISMIVSLEQEFSFEFPDEYLSIDLLKNIKEIEKVILYTQEH